MRAKKSIRKVYSHTAYIPFTLSLNQIITR